METTQTAVDWLVDKLMQGEFINNPDELIQQALAMEKEQIIDAFYEGMQANTFDSNKGRALMYYNKTYNK